MQEPASQRCSSDDRGLSSVLCRHWTGRCKPSNILSFRPGARIDCGITDSAIQMVPGNGKTAREDREFRHLRSSLATRASPASAFASLLLERGKCLVPLHDLNPPNCLPLRLGYHIDMGRRGSIATRCTLLQPGPTRPVDKKRLQSALLGRSYCFDNARRQVW